MKKTLTIAEARELFKSEKVFATDSGFIFNDSGKYRPGLTFVLDSSFELDKDGKVVNPIQYVSDREVTDSFNLDFDGATAIIFGDFWRSKKSAACFRPKDPLKAKHILVRVDWGGCFNDARGYYGNAVEECGATYFRRASSNGGGSGYDYWVLPVGYVHQIDKQYRIDWESARAYCAKHSKLQADQHTETDRLYRAKLAAEGASLEAKVALMPRLEEAAIALRSFNTAQVIICDELAFNDGAYFKLGYHEHLYSVEEVEKVEAYVEERRQVKNRRDAEEQAKQRAYEELSPKFMFLQDRALAVNLEIVIDDRNKAILKKLGSYGSGANLLEKEYSYENVQTFDAKIREKEAEVEVQRLAVEKLEREAEAKTAGLPSDIRMWKDVGGRTGCSRGYVIRPNGTLRERDRLHGIDSRRAARYDEGFEVWNQILPGELAILWTKECTAAEHVFIVEYRPETITEAQLECIEELQAKITEYWEGTNSPSVGEGWLGLLK